MILATIFINSWKDNEEIIGILKRDLHQMIELDSIYKSIKSLPNKRSKFVAAFCLNQ